jgi:hypothetical protein
MLTVTHLDSKSNIFIKIEGAPPCSRSKESGQYFHTLISVRQNSPLIKYQAMKMYEGSGGIDIRWWLPEHGMAALPQ